MLEFWPEGHADRGAAVFLVREEGRKVRAPLGRVLGNSQVPSYRERKVAQKHTASTRRGKGEIGR